MIIVYDSQGDFDSFLLVGNKYMFAHRHHKVLPGWSGEPVNLIIMTDCQNLIKTKESKICKLNYILTFSYGTSFVICISVMLLT